MAALMFRAEELSIEADDEVQTLGFQERYAAHTKSFALMNDAKPDTVRIAWNDGERGVDQAVVDVREIVVAAGRFTMYYSGVFGTGPYTAVSVTFDDARTPDIVGWLRDLASLSRDRIRISVPGAPERLE